LHSPFDSRSLPKKGLCTLLSHQTISCSESLKKGKKNSVQNVLDAVLSLHTYISYTYSLPERPDNTEFRKNEKWLKWAFRRLWPVNSWNIEATITFVQQVSWIWDFIWNYSKNEWAWLFCKWQFLWEFYFIRKIYKNQVLLPIHLLFDNRGRVGLITFWIRISI
jgi:hypothetical protein